MTGSDHKILNWGIIGAGNVCRRKSIPAILELSRSKIKCIVSQSGRSAQILAEDFSIPSWGKDPRLILDDPRIDIVYIATPPDSHLYFSRLAALAGKAILLEKPMASTFAQAREIHRLCEEKKIPLFLSYYRRALPHFVKIGRMIEDGVIGTVRHVHIDFYRPLNPDRNWRVDPAIAPGGYFDDLASHQLDLLTQYFGPADAVRGLVSNQAGAYEAPDTVSAVFSFKSGVTGSGIWCFNTDKAAFRDRIRFTGSSGYIECNTFIDGHFFWKTPKGEFEENITLPEHRHVCLFSQIENVLLQGGECVSTGTSGLETQRFMSLITEKRP